MQENKILCYYGCGQEGKFFITKSKKPCCSESWNKCSAMRIKNSIGLLNDKLNNPHTQRGKKYGTASPEWREQNKEKHIQSIQKRIKTLKYKYSVGLIVGHQKGKPLKEETKQKIRKARIEFLKNNPEKHPWKNKTKFISKPCEHLKNELRQRNIPYVEEFTPLEEKFYSIDIAFPDRKIGVEINGNQHYDSEGKLENYYQKRHDEIEKQGWKIYEFHYSLAYNIEKVLSILDLKELPPDYTEFIKSKKIKVEKRNWKEHVIKVRKEIYEKEKSNIEKVLNCQIDFSKFGWVTKVAILIGKPEQKVNSWMKKYLLDFYQTKCFKRKTKIALVSD